MVVIVICVSSSLIMHCVVIRLVFIVLGAYVMYVALVRTTYKLIVCCVLCVVCCV